MASLHHLSPPVRPSRNRVLTLALLDSNEVAPPGERLRLVFDDGTPAVPRPADGLLVRGGPVGPQPAATSHGSDGGEAG